jgi:DNA-binding NtrC family response regulator
VKGAFTGAMRAHRGKFQQAAGGTIFLDEIGELPADLQPRLLRVLQERTIDLVGGEQTVEVDLRIIAATNRNLQEAVAAGAFREDLYFRLNVVPIEVPPLRDRPEDISLLARHLIARHGKGKQHRLTQDLLASLEAYAWPGNVRELDNVCQRLVLLAEGEALDVDRLPEVLTTQSAPDAGGGAAADGEGSIRLVIPPEGASLEDLEKQIITAALVRCDYNQSRAARFLQIPRHVLLYRIEKFKIPTDR